MKKVLVILMALLLVVALAGCDFGNAGKDGNTGDTQGDTNNQPTYLTRARELVMNLETLPSSGEIYGTESASAAQSAVSASGGLRPECKAVSAAGEDITQPAPDYYDNPNWMPVIVPSQILHYDIVDSTIYFVSEDLKSRVMDNVKQLGIWVEFEFGAKAYARMTYNANTDTAVLEYLESGDGYNETSIAYYKIFSSYTSDGRVAIKASMEKYQKYNYHTVSAHSTFSIEYVEDESYVFSCFEPLYSTSGAVDEFGNTIIIEPTIAYTIILEKDLSGSEGELVIRYLEDSYPNSSDDLSTIHTILNWKDGEYVYSYTNSRAYLSTLGGKIVYITNDCDCFVNLYEVDGWDSCFRDGDTLTLTIGNQTYTNQLGNAKLKVVDEALMGGTYVAVPYLVLDEYILEDYYGIPRNEVNAEALLRVMNEIMEEYGLTPAGKSPSEAFEIIDARYKTTAAFGYENLEAIGKEEIKAFAESMKLFPSLSQEEMEVMFDEEHVLQSEQVEDGNYFDMIGASLSGTVTCSATGELDFSDIAVTVPASALMQKGSQYGIELLLRGKFDIKEYAVGNSTFEGVDMTLTFDADFRFDVSALGEDEYGFFLYVTKSDGTRISEYMQLGGDKDYAFTITAEAAGVQYEISSQKGILLVKGTLLPPPPETEE